MPSGPAAGAGLYVGDVLIAADGQALDRTGRAAGPAGGGADWHGAGGPGAPRHDIARHSGHCRRTRALTLASEGTRHLSMDILLIAPSARRRDLLRERLLGAGLVPAAEAAVPSDARGRDGVGRAGRCGAGRPRVDAGADAPAGPRRRRRTAAVGRAPARSRADGLGRAAGGCLADAAASGPRDGGRGLRRRAERLAASEHPRRSPCRGWTSTTTCRTRR